MLLVLALQGLHKECTFGCIFSPLCLSRFLVSKQSAMQHPIRCKQEQILKVVHGVRSYKDGLLAGQDMQAMAPTEVCAPLQGPV